MKFPAQLVKELREKTGAGILECQKALSGASGDLERAVEYLRKQGLRASDTKAARVAADGLVAGWVSPDSCRGILLEVNCETDFVAKNDDFKKFAADVVAVIAQKNPASMEDLFQSNLASGEKISETLSRLVARIGEKLSVRRFVVVSASAGEKVGSYIHLGSKIGVLVVLKGSRLGEGVAKDLSMHVAASHPLYLNRSDIPEAVWAGEREIIREQMRETDKPQNILDKIIGGKLAKFATEVCLMDQVFIKDPAGKKSVKQILKEIDPTLTVTSFIRYQVGEGIEKKKDDFAAEVSRMAQ